MFATSLGGEAMAQVLLDLLFSSVLPACSYNHSQPLYTERDMRWGDVCYADAHMMECNNHKCDISSIHCPPSNVLTVYHILAMVTIGVFYHADATNRLRPSCDLKHSIAIQVCKVESHLG